MSSFTIAPSSQSGETSNGSSSNLGTSTTGLNSTTSSAQDTGLEANDAADDESTDTDADQESAADGIESDAGDWGACSGAIPRACLSISADTESCPGTVGGCEWHACASDRSTRAQIDYLECLADECDFEPVLDIECLREWADLALECFETMCKSTDPQACAFLNRGAQHDCHE